MGERGQRLERGKNAVFIVEADGLVDDVSAVVVCALETVWPSGAELLAAKFVSPE